MRTEEIKRSSTVFLLSLAMVLSIVSVTFTFTQLSRAQPEEERHLIVISIDSCRWDYLQDENLINIRQMIDYLGGYPEKRRSCLSVIVQGHGIYGQYLLLMETHPKMLSGYILILGKYNPWVLQKTETAYLAFPDVFLTPTLYHLMSIQVS